MTGGRSAPGAVAGGAVHVWLIRADVPAPVLAALAAVLDSSERERAARASPSRRRLFTAVHGAARFIVGGYLGIPPSRVRWRYGPHGKPELAGAGTGVQVSLSHSGGLAAVAITVGRAIGVDIQRFPRAADAVRVAARFYPPDEARFVAAGGGVAQAAGGETAQAAGGETGQAAGGETAGAAGGAAGGDAGQAADGEAGQAAGREMARAAGGDAGQAARFSRLWARKEACVKVTGGQLIEGLKLPVHGTGSITVHDPGGPLPGPYLVQDVPGPPGFSTAVAVAGPEPCRVTHQWWPGPEPGTGQVYDVLLAEQRRFADLLTRGRRVLGRLTPGRPLGEEDFRYLHDTYGLPRELVLGLLAELA